MAVKDNFNSYYTQLLNKMRESYPTLVGGTVYKATPASFPYMYFSQIDGSTALQTLSRTEDGINLGVQLEIYSTTSAQEARSMSAEARSFMVSLDFRCVFYAPVENEDDTSIYRFIGRYEKLDT